MSLVLDLGFDKREDRSEKVAIKLFVIPAKAGIQNVEKQWIPAYAGMTDISA
ncbi:hypothetical protein [Permianibacter aggregans]|uniref:hypothetical protein n=1 Tax=Permianibacter aggregans TaxID=1510150 RepID=UPI0012FBD650|nr:hypothetical protein [Permianibacter aggregans]